MLDAVGSPVQTVTPDPVLERLDIGQNALGEQCGFVAKVIGDQQVAARLQDGGPVLLRIGGRRGEDDGTGEAEQQQVLHPRSMFCRPPSGKELRRAGILR